MDTVNESLTTVEDGDTTVNERLSPGGEGPEGQPDTATEIVAAEVPEKQPEPAAEAEPEKKPAKRKARS